MTQNTEAESVVVDNTGAETAAGVETFRSSPIVPGTALSMLDGDVDPGGIVWVPSDPTGATDMTTELEAFVAANAGKTVKVAPGSTIQLNNAFSSVTTGDILLDLTDCVVRYNHMTSADAAIKCDNTANASPEVSVSSLSLVTVNTDAYVSRLTLAATLNVARFDWVAVYSSDVNPGKAGNYLGEIFQAITAESSLQVTATRVLNRHSRYATSVKARKLNPTRKVRIRGGTFTANGNPFDHTITSRSIAIQIMGFVDPEVHDVRFWKCWSMGVRFQCCAAPKWSNVYVADMGNLANYQGYTYGVQVYGMNDQADGRNIVTRNGRHAAVTTDGDSGSPTTWYKKGIVTNSLIQGVHAYNSHGSPVDTHEPSDNTVFDGVYVFYSCQDEDVNPNFTGLGLQIRGANVTVRNMVVFGGARGFKINAIDHGFEDRVVLENINIRDLASAGNTDIGVQIDDESAMTNKRHVYFDGAIRNAGVGIQVGKTAKLTVRSLSAAGVQTAIDAYPGSIVSVAGNTDFDYRSTSRPAPYFITKVRSDATSGGASVVYLRRPVIIKGTNNTPTEVLTESDTVANKPIYIPGITEYNPSAVTATVAKSPGATTFTLAPVTFTPADEAASTAGVTSSSITDATAVGRGILTAATAARVRDVASTEVGPMVLQGMAGWAFDPACAASNFNPVAGTLCMIRVVAATSTNITRLYVGVSAASSVAATANRNFLGLFDASRNLLAGTITGSIDSQLSTTGTVTGTIASTAVAAGTVYYIGFLWNGTASVFSLARGSAVGILNVNTGSAPRFATCNTAVIALPSTASALNANTSSVWAAMAT